MDGSSDLLFTCSWVIKYILLSETGSEFGFVLDFLLVSFDEINSFGERVVIGAEEALLFKFCVLHGAVGSTFTIFLRFVKVGPDFKLIDFSADIPVGVVVSGLSASVDHGVSRLGYWIISKA
jgi:hypothetical protein